MTDKEIAEIAFNYYCKTCIYCKNVTTNNERYDICMESDCSFKKKSWTLMTGFIHGFKEAMKLKDE